MSRRVVSSILILSAFLMATPGYADRCLWCRVWTEPDTGEQDSECVRFVPPENNGTFEKLAACNATQFCYYNWGQWHCFAGCEGYQCFDV